MAATKSQVATLASSAEPRKSQKGWTSQLQKGSNYRKLRDKQQPGHSSTHGQAGKCRHRKEPDFHSPPDSRSQLTHHKENPGAVTLGVPQGAITGSQVGRPVYSGNRAGSSSIHSLTSPPESWGFGDRRRPKLPQLTRKQTYTGWVPTLTVQGPVPQQAPKLQRALSPLPKSPGQEPAGAGMSPDNSDPTGCRGPALTGSRCLECGGWSREEDWVAN